MCCDSGGEGLLRIGVLAMTPQVCQRHGTTLTRMRRRPQTLLGVVLAAVGAIWFLQGVGVLPGSFMSGDPFWAAVGGVLLALSAVVWVTRRPGRS